ncbi:MAG: phosphate ABC transporter substrate-binding protein [Bacteroidota bacterium]|jgi:phosphate transport system substrate-binding protein
MKTTNLVLFILILLLVGGCGRKSDQPNNLQIKGSDTMVNLGQAWAEEYMKQNPGTSIAVTGGGSGTGITGLINSTCDVAEVSREMKESEIELVASKGSAPQKIVVALDGLAVVVNPANKISELTIDQLADIFTGRIKNWKELGGRDAKIVLLSREVNSGTHVYFKEHVLRHGKADGKEEFAAEALLLSSSQAIADEVAQNQDAIGYYGMGYITAKEKAIKVAKDKNSPYEAPTMENVISGAYPISRPLLMYTKGEPQGLAKTFIDYVLSPAGQQIVKKLDFVPVKPLEQGK